MKKIMISLLMILMSLALTAAESAKLEHLTLDSFRTEIFDWEANSEWQYKGDLPAIIDFYADWCGPCKQIAPILVELAEEYEGKLLIYKVDTDDQKQLAGMFGIRSIPSILFIPMNGQPQMSAGALPKAEFERMIKEILKVE